MFQNKDLAADRKPLDGSVVKNWLGEPSRMYRAWAFQNSQSRLFVTGTGVSPVEDCGKVY